MMEILTCLTSEVEPIYISIKELRINSELYDWYTISYWNNLSIDFIEEFADKIKFRLILKNKYVSDEIKDFCRIFL
jgi:hypothetical protein